MYIATVLVHKIIHMNVYIILVLHGVLTQSLSMADVFSMSVINRLSSVLRELAVAVNA